MIGGMMGRLKTIFLIFLFYPTSGVSLETCIYENVIAAPHSLESVK
jgi:hypothetical protein